MNKNAVLGWAGLGGVGGLSNVLPHHTASSSDVEGLDIVIHVLAEEFKVVCVSMSIGTFASHRRGGIRKTYSTARAPTGARHMCCYRSLLDTTQN